MTSRPYQTKTIELAAAIKTLAKIDPDISFDETGLATFTFPENPEVTAVVMHYDNGILVDARTVLNTRNQLFKRIRGAR